VFETFETSEFLIRKINVSDVNAIYNNWAREIDVARYTTWVPHESEQVTHDYVESCITAWDKGSYTWIIERKADAEIVGSIAAREQGHKLEVGYLLAKHWWGKGIMSEIVRTFIHDAFKIKRIQRIGAVCDLDNPASKRVMEKAGMHYEGVLSSWLIHPNLGTKARDCYCLSITQ